MKIKTSTTNKKGETQDKDISPQIRFCLAQATSGAVKTHLLPWGSWRHYNCLSHHQSTATNPKSFGSSDLFSQIFRSGIGWVFLHCPTIFRLWPESSLKTMYYRSDLYAALKLTTGCQDTHFHLKSFALRDTHRKFLSWVLYNHLMNTRKSTVKLRKT